MKRVDILNIVNENKKYKTATHLTFSCQYHVIFCPKYRRRVLKDGIDERLKEIIYEVANKYDFDVPSMEIMEDHVHLIIDCNPRFGIMDCVTKIKNISSKLLRDEYPQLKRKLPSLWTRSSFISTVGTVSLETVKKYIENQKNV